MASTSSIFQTICEIRSSVFEYREKSQYTNLQNYTVGLNDYLAMIYVTAEVHPDNLDNGSDPTTEARQYAKIYGVNGDIPHQLIPKELGGPEHSYNIFPLNEELDITAWKEDERLVYEHVKKGDNRYAKLTYGMTLNIERDSEVGRANIIYYFFELFQDGKLVGIPIEGVFENKSLYYTNRRRYCTGRFNR